MPHPSVKTISVALTRISLAFLILILLGCAATTRDINPEESIHYDAAYDFSDKKRIVNDLTTSLLNSPTVPANTDQPVIIIYGVANHTSEHIDTGGITDDIRLALLQADRYRLNANSFFTH